MAQYAGLWSGDVQLRMFKSAHDLPSPIACPKTYDFCSKVQQKLFQK